jgi:hypothetical protein
VSKASKKPGKKMPPQFMKKGAMPAPGGMPPGMQPGYAEGGKVKKKC